MSKIYMWPDGSWCYPEDLEEYLTWKSDDYEEVGVPESFFNPIPEDLF